MPRKTLSKPLALLSYLKRGMDVPNGIEKNSVELRSERTGGNIVHIVTRMSSVHDLGNLSTELFEGETKRLGRNIG